MNDNSETNNESTADADDGAIVRSLRAMPRPVAPGATREAHLAAALAEFDSLASESNVAPSNVVSLVSRRRPRLMALTAVAAAALFAVGLGVGRSVGRSGAPDPAAVKNAALTASNPPSSKAAATCADVGITDAATPIARFGTYAVHRTTVAGRATIVIVDASCKVVTQIDLGG